VLLPNKRKRRVFFVFSRGGENEMKKRIVFVGLCMVLLLIFMSSAYGGYDPKYKLKAHPWDEMNLCPGEDTTIVNCDQTPSYNAPRVWWIDVAGVKVFLIRDLNFISYPRNRERQPSTILEK
jgi:hypothetical protein